MVFSRRGPVQTVHGGKGLRLLRVRGAKRVRAGERSRRPLQVAPRSGAKADAAALAALPAAGGGARRCLTMLARRRPELGGPRRRRAAPPALPLPPDVTHAAKARRCVPADIRRRVGGALAEERYHPAADGSFVLLRALTRARGHGWEDEHDMPTLAAGHGGPRDCRPHCTDCHDEASRFENKTLWSLISEAHRAACGKARRARPSAATMHRAAFHWPMGAGTPIWA
eukprot:gene12168-biopygen4748